MVIPLALHTMQMPQERIAIKKVHNKNFRFSLLISVISFVIWFTNLTDRAYQIIY